jgi:hypothetical protein
MLEHLLNRGGALNFSVTKELLSQRDEEWNINKNPQVYFNQVEKAIKGLAQNGITSDLNKRRDVTLYHLKAAGEFDAAVRKWESKPTAEKTWGNIETFISTEYAKKNKQNKLTAKHFKANALQEQAEATKELIAMLTDAHTKQMKNLVKTTTKAMKEVMLLIRENKTPNVSATVTEKKKIRNEKQKNI